MKAGIIGGRGAGKSTVFRALTGLAPTGGHADSKNRARPGQIKVPDSRLDYLHQVYSSKKRIPGELTVLDFAPNPKEQKAGAALDLSLLPLIRELDTLLLVIPEFAGNATELMPALQSLEGELVFTDFEQAERRLERLKKEKRPSDLERAALESCLKQLEAGLPLRTLEFSAQELQKLSAFCFLTLKPALVVVNCDPERTAASPDLQLDDNLKPRGLESLRLAAAFEAELSELRPAEQQELLREARLESPARDRLIALFYRHIGLITFYTAAEQEARAWPLERGATASDAAGKIHSDIARGFIRAEVMSYSDFAECGSEAKVKAAGKFRVEGKDYVIQDGDIIHIRFKV